jgi:hypothetical protein
VKDRLEDDGSLEAEKAELGRYEEFLRQELPSKVRQALESRIEAAAPALLEESLKGQLVDIVHDLQLQLFQTYKATRSQAEVPQGDAVGNAHASAHAQPTQPSVRADRSTTSPSNNGIRSPPAPPSQTTTIPSSSTEGTPPDLDLDRDLDRDLVRNLGPALAASGPMELGGPGPSWSESPGFENAFVDFDGQLFDFVMPPLSEFSGDSAGDSGYGGGGGGGGDFGMPLLSSYDAFGSFGVTGEARGQML